jgi:hypothetical protein
MALTQFGTQDLGKDEKLMTSVGQMSTEAPAEVKSSAKQFLAKFKA